MFSQVFMDHNQFGNLFSVKSIGFRPCNNVNGIRIDNDLGSVPTRELHDSYY